MRKTPTLFERDPDDLRRVVPEVHPDCQWVLDGDGVATRKYDGTCVLIRRDGITVHAFVRREVKRGKEPPPNFMELDHDPVTDKRVGWEPAEQSGFAKLIAEAVNDAFRQRDRPLPGTYELCGPKVNRNPEGFERHILIAHDQAEFGPALLHGPQPAGRLDDVFRVFRDHLLKLGEMGWEGVVWHHPDGRMAKLKARDFHQWLQEREQQPAQIHVTTEEDT